jgi:hypothetical protein
MKRLIKKPMVLFAAAILMMNVTAAFATTYTACKEEGADENDAGDCTQATAGKPCDAGKTCTEQKTYGIAHCNCV